MTPSRSWNAMAAVLVAVILASPAWSAPPDSSLAPIPVELGPGSALWLEGTSTVHDFESRSKEVEIVLRGDPGAPAPRDAAELMQRIRSSSVRSVFVRVPVVSLKSDKEKLDTNLRKAMKADQYPDVVFELGDAEVVPGGSPDTVRIQARGVLTITGRQKPITLESRAWAAADGVQLEGSHVLLMSEYGIKPPKMMLGTLKVHDRITVRYKLLLVPQEGSAR